MARAEPCREPARGVPGQERAHRSKATPFVRGPFAPGAYVPERAGPGLISFAAALAVLLYLWRSGDSTLHPQFVAEDGRVFFVGAKLQGAASLIRPYAGYIHLLPRLAALAASAWPSAMAPSLQLACAALIVGWSAATVASAEQPRAWLLAPAMLLVPTDGEVFGTLTNVRWLTGAALALVVATPAPRGRLARANQVAFALLASLTGPFALFTLPVTAYRLWQGRHSPFDRRLCGVVLAGAAVQVGYLLSEPSATSSFEAPLRFALNLLDRWIGQAAHPGRTARPAHLRDIAVLVAAAAVSAAAVPRLSVKLYAVACTLLLATFVRFIGDNSYFDYIGAADRYFYIPRLVVLWTLLLCLAQMRIASLAGAVGLVLMVAAVDPWTKEPYPHIPWRAAAEAIDRGLPVRVIINPSPADETDPAAWAVAMPARP